MNAIYLCAIAQPWISVIKQLDCQFNIKPSYIVHWKNDKKQFIKANLKSCHLQQIDDAWKGLGFPAAADRYIFDEQELKEISSYELVALKMMDRLDPDGESFPFNTRLYFFRDLLGYWFNIVEQRNIDIVISPSVPHRVFDYALYVVCKMKSIKFLMFQLTPFGSNSILINDIEKMPLPSDDGIEYLLPSKEVQEKITKVYEDYNKAVPDYMVKHEANAKKDYAKLSLSYSKKLSQSYKLLTSSPNTYWVESGFLPNETQYSWFKFYAMQLKRKNMVETIKKDYSDIVIQELPNSFVLVALHYQPEETSCPTGGTYSDQILMIQLLNQQLPENTTILVKEHKSQFYSHQESASGRNSLFYRRISQISDRIKFVSESHDPFELIDQAQAVVTISGTIGWESAIRGTPVLVFGRAWYEGMPRVFKVKTKSDILEAWRQLSEQKDKDCQSEMMRFHAKLEKKFVRAKHYKSYLNNEDVTMAESVDNIVHGIVKFLELKSNI
ncbi:capsular polysaccharide export protein, LipB/KpsS family [Psychrobacter aquaticus]|uniref:Capsule polysaccharide biosynthesis protein n=1 Tax=Psychrobacter aquaticus CMS 56 TaxID=1354303 RepID=U4T7U4_9GAMM|nr:hypothetical protein [Psychrobacter aquaticus]ERL56201.1 hypothetical protein M917_0879 [Psychrobacter aquaticus CMS 56]